MENRTETILNHIKEIEKEFNAEMEKLTPAQQKNRVKYMDDYPYEKNAFCNNQKSKMEGKKMKKYYIDGETYQLNISEHDNIVMTGDKHYGCIVEHCINFGTGVFDHAPVFTSTNYDEAIRRYDEIVSSEQQCIAGPGYHPHHYYELYSMDVDDDGTEDRPETIKTFAPSVVSTAFCGSGDTFSIECRPDEAYADFMEVVSGLKYDEVNKQLETYLIDDVKDGDKNDYQVINETGSVVFSVEWCDDECFCSCK